MKQKYVLEPVYLSVGIFKVWLITATTNPGTDFYFYHSHGSALDFSFSIDEPSGLLICSKIYFITVLNHARNEQLLY